MSIQFHSAVSEALRHGATRQTFRNTCKNVELPCQSSLSIFRVSSTSGSNRLKPSNASGSDSASNGNGGGAGPASPPDSWRRLMPSTSSPPGLGQFRPPSLPIPGANGPRLGSEGVEAVEEKAKRIGDLLDLVRDSRGPWQDRAAAISVLQREGGYTTESLYDLTYLSIDKQTSWVVAGQVYESLVSDGASEDILAEFEEPQIEILYEMRTLSQRQRKAAAEYVVENSLGVDGAKELAKAIKDHERRPVGRDGFTVAPGDCLAFTFHRAAQEARDTETRDVFVARGLELTASESARARFEEF